MIMDVKTAFLTALEKESDEERLAYLDTACSNDSDLRERVDRLIEAHNNAQGFLDPEAFGSDILAQPPFSNSKNAVIDRYTLVKKIGEGGMAIVYMAEQTQPIRREVALKVIKLGMDTAEVIARFEIERQALALMDHPSIAKVLDAGVTEAGKPYFVMELVRGVCITEYCDTHKLSTPARLDLFGTVCDAIHHAHQKGIIHRDLKPSNILVTLRDNKPVPMIIDFGIAKATHQRLTEKTLFTLHTQLMGTPEYMSPEQAEMSDTDIDIRTDIYSLGVVLYELLAGTSPFDATTLRRAALGEIQRIIREEEPLRPSTRISAMGDAAIDIAEQRGTNVAELTKRLNRELEWIPLKAMRKDRSRRYRSASELSDDIGNYLDDRPLLAGPESAVYRLRKAVHKHRIPVLALSAVAATLIVGLVISASLYVNMRQALNAVAQLEIQKEIDNKLVSLHRLRGKGESKIALEEIGALPEATKKRSEICLMKAQLYIDLGQFKPAENELLQLIQSASQNDPQIAGVTHSLLARIYLPVDSVKAHEHRQLAESTLPETAKDFYMRGMFATSADEALAWFSEAVEHDFTHYEARKARAFANYSLKDYEAMAKDASILAELHPNDYMGHALQAIALGEMGQCDLALKEHGQAIALCSMRDELPRLYDQRRNTLIRSGRYKEALEDSELAAALRPKEVSYPDFTALMALGEHGKIETEYERLARMGEGPGRYVKAYAEKCTFELLNEGHPFTLPPEIVASPPFYIMGQAAELHARLKERATPLPIHGALWKGGWSPNGQSIAYGQFNAFSWLPGTLEGLSSKIAGRSIEILDLESGETGQIASLGYHLSWSPDGQYIAFSDHYQGGKSNVWVAPLAGGQPRKIAPGIRPNWSQDSQHIFFWADANTIKENAAGIYSRDIGLANADPVGVVQNQEGRHYGTFSLSPDTSLVAVEKLDEIVVLTFPGEQEVARWELPWPLQIWATQMQWHPNGKTIIINSHSQYNQMGMCLLDIESGEMTHVFNVSRPWCRTVWSPDGSQMLMSPYAQETWWLWDIDPDLPLTETLAPALTTDDFLTQRLTKWNERIETDPLNADNYVSRAVVFMALKDFDAAKQDLNHGVTLIHESNDPACTAINHWAWIYAKTERTTESQLWTIHKDRLTEKFPAPPEKSE